jgi:hypothetical protein
VIAARAWSEQHAAQYVEIKYEELVQYPEQAMRKLCEALSLPFSSQLLTFRQQETVFEPQTGQRLKLYTAPDPSRIDLWREWLTGDDVHIVEAICSREMAWWGYEISAPTVASLRLCLRMVRENLSYGIKRLAKRAARKVQRYVYPSRIP